MLEHVHIQNYRSFVDASAKLSPFTLVIGANASGKTNFLRLFRDLNRGTLGGGYALDSGSHPDNARQLMPHLSRPKEPTKVSLTFDGLPAIDCSGADINGRLPWPVGSLNIFAIDPDKVSAPEGLIANPFVEGDGTGTARVYDMLKTGVNDEIADQIHDAVLQFIPELTRIGVRLVGTSIKEIEARERGVDGTTEGRYLSAGTRILLALITAIHQPSPPPLMLIDDLDHGLHPRLLGKLLEFLQNAARDFGIQVIATTHNANLVNHFLDNPEAVLLVEKENGASTITPLSERLAAIDYDKADAPDMPLGDLWYGGFVGGVPKFTQP